MLSDTLNMIDGVAAYPVVALVTFVAVFVGILIWVFRLNRQQLETMSRIPLSDSDRTAEGERTDG